MEELGVPYRVSFAQNREDIYLDYFLRDVEKGFYVDVGANDPNVDSVTKLFYEKGWKGINIEPIASLHASLTEQRPRDLNLNVGVSSKSGVMKFREYHTYHGLSTMVKDMQHEYDKSAQNNTNLKDFSDYTVPVKTLKQIFEEHNVGHIHFLKVDVEGFEYEVLEGNDWQAYRPEVICIESNHVRKDWSGILSENGYKLAFNDGLNDYYVANDASRSAKSFNYVEAILPVDYKPIFVYDIVRRVNELTERFKLEKSALELEKIELWNKVNEVQYALDLADAEIAASKKMKAIFRALAIKTNAIIEEQIYPIAKREILVSGEHIPDVPIVSTIRGQYEAIDENDRAYLSQLKVKQNRIRGRVLHGYRAAKRPVKFLALGGIKTVRKAKRMIRKNNGA